MNHDLKSRKTTGGIARPPLPGGTNAPKQAVIVGFGLEGFLCKWADTSGFPFGEQFEVLARSLPNTASGTGGQSVGARDLTKCYPRLLVGDYTLVRWMTLWVDRNRLKSAWWAEEGAIFQRVRIAGEPRWFRPGVEQDT